MHKLLFQRGEYDNLLHTTDKGTTLKVAETKDGFYYWTMIEPEAKPWYRLPQIPYKDRDQLGQMVTPAIPDGHESETTALNNMFITLNKVYGTDLSWQLEDSYEVAD